MKQPYMPAPDEYLKTLDQQPSAPLPPSKPRRRWKRRITIFILLLLAVAIAAIVYTAINLSSVSKRPFSMSGLKMDQTGRTNVLVLGVGNPGHSGQNLSDTNMVISFDTRGKQVAMISLPRDLRVKLPGYGFGKINRANALGGSELAREVVEETLDIPIHYAVTTNFDGLEEIVDAVGGIEVDVKERLFDPEYPCDDNQFRACGLDIQPGLQRMDGAQALKYVRCRKGTCGNDFGRAERQQEVIALVQEKATDPNILLNPAKLSQITAAVRNNLETDLSATDILRLASLWKSQQNKPITLVLSTDADSYLRNFPGTSDLVPKGGNFETIQERVNSIFQP